MARNYLFNKVPVSKIKKNKFNLSFLNNLSCDFGQLIPILTQEVLPGDDFRISAETFVRLAPMVAPAYTSIDCYIHYFFVPNRIVFEDWQEFIAEDMEGNIVHPYIPLSQLPYNDYKAGTLFDYLGVNVSQPINPNRDVRVNALPFRAYQLIYNEYYRDENLQPINPELPLGQGIDNYQYKILYRNWPKDYFTSCLPSPQYGGDTVLPIVGDMPIEADGQIRFKKLSGTQITHNKYVKTSLDAGHDAGITTDDNTEPFLYHSGLMVNLQGASSTTINDLRRAIKIQEWKERSMRSGHRYIEYLFGQFEEISSDARLQRPQYIGGSKTPVLISEIQQTSATEQGTSPQGNLAGKGTAIGSMRNIYFKSEEHGFILAIMSIMPRSSYMTGIHRKFTRFDKFDYALPVFANLGEQEVLNQELYLSDSDNVGLDDQGNLPENLEVFGYQPRYAEYKTALDEVHGDFKHYSQYWHSGRQFLNTPTLNSEFINFGEYQNRLSQNRLFAVQGLNSHKFYCSIYNNVSVLRKLPKFGIPMI